ncbi:MAG: plasmid recombination protein [Gallionellaceae bacterium]
MEHTAHSQFMRVKKLKGAGIIKLAARHNLREIQAEMGADRNIDPARTSQNIVLFGEVTADAVARCAQNLMKGIKQKKALRADAVMGLEIIFSLPRNSGINEQHYFSDSVNWADKFFEVPILSAVIHNDEAAPHCHVLLLPLFDGRMIGGGLMGNKTRLKEMQANYFKMVGVRYGLTRQPKATRYGQAARERVAMQSIAALKDAPSKLNDPAIRDVLRDALAANPEPLAVLLGLAMPKPKEPPKKTFAGIMAKPFKPDKSIDFTSRNRL